MMEKSVTKEEREKNKRSSRVCLPRTFITALDSIVKEREKKDSSASHYIEQYKASKFSRSEKISNEPTAIPVKQPTHYQEEISPPNLKGYENHTKDTLNSCQSVVKDEDESESDMQTIRMPRLHSFNSSEHYIAGHNYNIQKSYSKTNDHNASSKHSKSGDIYQGEHLPFNGKSCKGHNKMPSNSEHNFIPRMPKPVRSHNSSNVSDKHVNAKCDYNEKKTNCNILNTDSNIYSTPLKTVKHYSNQSCSYDSLHKNFNNYNSNFKQFSYNQSQSHHQSNIKKNSYSSQQYDFQKDNLSRNLPKGNSDKHMKLKKSNPDYVVDQNTKVDDIEEDSFSDNNLDLKNHFEDVNTEMKHQRCCLELDENIGNSMKKNIRVICKSVPDSGMNVSPTSDSSSVSSVSDAQVCLTLSTSTPIISSTPMSPVSTVSSIIPARTISSESMISDFSPMLPLETGLNSTLCYVFDGENLNNDNKILVCSDYTIPPPAEPLSAADKLCSNAERNIFLPQNSESESTEEDLCEDEAYFLLPDSAHIEAISNFIFKTVEERSVSFTVADKVVNDLQRLFKNHFEGNVIDYYGSYYTDLAITTSDINLVIKADASIRKSFMYEIYKILQNELEKYHVLPYDEGTSTYKSKINFTHPNTGINCELIYLGRTKEGNYFKMGKFLKLMCVMDKRVKPLIIIAKVWAEHSNINEIEDGKLHPIGFTLSIIHFLQHCENPILPICSKEEDIKDMKKDLAENDLPIGALWLGFLKYYAFTFNWQKDVLTVTSVGRVSKISKQWENFWIAIEDPFTGKNIAASVINKDVADHIKSCFRHTYNHFLSGREITSSDNDENQSSTESGSSQLEFSFNDCTIEQNEDICEKCEEIDDVCDECKKKIYVPPMASVPKMTDDFLKVVKKALLTVYDKYMLSDEEVKERMKFVQKLEIDVRKIYKDAKMSLFGSSANGFGFKKSDLDICMTFESEKEFPAFAVLRSLRRLLQRNTDFVDVIAIFNAQIPILKFRYKPQGWRGDISLNNVLAFHNSKLLHTYSLIDERSKILGCALKLIAKKALIAEVTEKALSSYSYLIMVIHFLQQTNPPVLPVLQDIQIRHEFELTDIVDNCNVWFCKNMDDIKKIFKSENNTPVEELFLDLLDYYCSFDYDRVITIRQKEILTLPFCENMRSARLFNIQDPFLVNKNLGCVVSPAKAQETKSVFNRARMLFRTPKKESLTDLENHFFSTMSLTGRIQKEALCNCCGKFGHDQNDCKQFSPLKNNFFKFNPRKKAIWKSKCHLQKNTAEQTMHWRKFVAV